MKVDYSKGGQTSLVICQAGLVALSLSGPLPQSLPDKRKAPVAEGRIVSKFVCLPGPPGVGVSIGSLIAGLSPTL